MLEVNCHLGNRKFGLYFLSKIPFLPTRSDSQFGPLSAKPYFNSSVFSSLFFVHLKFVHKFLEWPAVARGGGRPEGRFNWWFRVWGGGGVAGVVENN